MIAAEETIMAPDMNSEELLPSEKSDIYVIPNPDPDSAVKFLVVPGTFGIPEDGKRIRIRNVTDTLVKVTFKSDIGTGSPIDVPHKVSQPFDLKKAPVGVYEYDVDVHVPGLPPVKAQGGSNPRIVYG
jgi:hypothetical protein